jgi:proline-specific peptidase
MSNLKEGRLVIDENKNEIFYRFFGLGAEVLVCLHGGPGQGQGYLKVLEKLQVPNLKLLFYDQLGAGQSDDGANVEWGVERFVEELETVRKGLELDGIHLFGHSWGGMLAMQYAIEYGKNVKSLILSNTAANMTKIMADILSFQSTLPRKHYQTMLKAISGIKIPIKDLEEARLEFNARYLRRATPFDIEVSKKEYMELFPATRDAYGPSFQGLWGEDPFESGCVPCNGPLLDWDVSERLQDITAPTLILGGMYDEITPEQHADLARKIPDNQFVIFGNSSHFMTHEKEADLYLAVIERFMTRMIQSEPIGP